MKNYSLNRDFSFVDNYKEVTLPVEVVLERVKTILKNKKIKIKEKNWSYIQHTSSNPTGTLHLGHLFNAYLGDLFCRLNQTQGRFFVNDFGWNFSCFSREMQKAIKEKKALNISSIYNEAISGSNQEANVKKRKDLQKNGLSVADKKVRSMLMKKILQQFKVLNLKKVKLVYESKAQKDIRKTYEELSLGSEKTELEGVRLITSESDYLYVFTDYVYRLKVDDKYPGPKLISLGPSNLKGNEEVNHLLKVKGKKQWDHITYPILKNNKEKLSKRKNNLATKEEFLNYFRSHLKEELVLGVSKLWVYEQVTNSVLDFQDFKSEKYLHKIKHLSRIISTNDDKLESFDALNLQNLKLFNIWANISAILARISLKKEPVKIVKLLERIHDLNKKSNKEEKILNNQLLILLRRKLGL